MAGTRGALQPLCETGVRARGLYSEKRVARNIHMHDRWRERGDRKKEPQFCEIPKNLITLYSFRNYIDIVLVYYTYIIPKRGLCDAARLHTKEPEEATCRLFQRFEKATTSTTWWRREHNLHKKGQTQAGTVMALWRDRASSSLRVAR